MSLAVSLQAGGSVEHTEITVNGKDVRFEMHIRAEQATVDDIRCKVEGVCRAMNRPGFDVVNVYNIGVLQPDQHRNLIMWLRTALLNHQN